MLGGKEIVLQEAVHGFRRGPGVGVLENERQDLKGVDEAGVHLVCFEQLSHHSVFHPLHTHSLQERSHGLQHGSDAFVGEELKGTAERGEEGGAQSHGNALRSLQEGKVPRENVREF